MILALCIFHVGGNNMGILLKANKKKVCPDILGDNIVQPEAVAIPVHCI